MFIKKGTIQYHKYWVRTKEEELDQEHQKNAKWELHITRTISQVGTRNNKRLLRNKNQRNRNMILNTSIKKFETKIKDWASCKVETKIHEVGIRN